MSTTPTGNPIITPVVQFPIEVEIKFKFLVENSEQYEYLTSTTPEFSISKDAMWLFEDHFGIKCVECNGVKLH